MTNAVESNIVSYAKVANGRTAADSADRIDWVKVSLMFLPLASCWATASP